MTDPWQEATFGGHERAQRARAAARPAADRLAALEAMLRDAHRLGLLARWREGKQQEVLRAWHQDG